MITKGSILKLVKPLPYNFLKVGDYFKVLNVTEDGVILLQSKTSKGFISHSEFKKYFAEVEPPRTWSKWSNCRDIDLISEGEKIKSEFRSNGKRVEVRTRDLVDGVIVGYSCCHENDNFDLIKGVELAHARLKLKLLEMLF